MADMITTCFSGRNRRCGEAFVKLTKSEFDTAQFTKDKELLDKCWKAVEKQELKGQKIAGELNF